MVALSFPGGWIRVGGSANFMVLLTKAPAAPLKSASPGVECSNYGCKGGADGTKVLQHHPEKPQCFEGNQGVRVQLPDSDCRGWIFMSGCLRGLNKKIAEGLLQVKRVDKLPSKLRSKTIKSFGQLDAIFLTCQWKIGMLLKYMRGKIRF